MPGTSGIDRAPAQGRHHARRRSSCSPRAKAQPHPRAGFRRRHYVVKPSPPRTARPHPRGDAPLGTTTGRQRRPRRPASALRIAFTPVTRRDPHRPDRMPPAFLQPAERVFARSARSRVGRKCLRRERTIDVHIRRLRKTLEPYKQNLVQTVRGWVIAFRLRTDRACHFSPANPGSAIRNCLRWRARCCLAGRSAASGCRSRVDGSGCVKLRRLWRLLARLTGGRRLPPASSRSVWSEMEGLLHRRQDDVRNRKRRLLDVLRVPRRRRVLPDGGADRSQHAARRLVQQKPRTPRIAPSARQQHLSPTANAARYRCG